MLITPSCEWRDMSRAQRVRYFLSPWSVTWLLVFAAVAAIRIRHGDVGHGFAIFGLAVLCCVPFWLRKLYTIGRSLERTDGFW
jgi:hypothetical protein